MKRKFILEVHNFAPELNNIRFIGTKKTIRVSGKFTLKDAKNSLFTQIRVGKYATITVNNPDHTCLNKVYQGYFTDLKALKGIIDSLKERHITGPGAVKGTTLSVKTKLIG